MNIHSPLSLFNTQSALTGGVLGVIAMSWISLKAQWAIASGAIKYQTKHITVDHCDYRFDHSNLPLSAANMTDLNAAAE